jgi:hypothetical protein
MDNADSIWRDFWEPLLTNADGCIVPSKLKRVLAAYYGLMKRTSGCRLCEQGLPHSSLPSADSSDTASGS